MNDNNINIENMKIDKNWITEYKKKREEYNICG